MRQFGDAGGNVTHARGYIRAPPTLVDRGEPVAHPPRDVMEHFVSPGVAQDAIELPFLFSRHLVHPFPRSGGASDASLFLAA